MGQEQNHSWIRCGCTSHLFSVLKDFKFLMCHRLIKAPPFFLLWPLFSPSKPHTLIIYIWRYIRQIQPAFARLTYVPREKKNDALTADPKHFLLHGEKNRSFCLRFLKVFQLKCDLTALPIMVFFWITHGFHTCTYI